MPTPTTASGPYGCRYVENPGIFSSPSMTGTAPDMSTTKNGSTWRNVTRNSVSPANRADSIVSPGAIPSRLALTSIDPASRTWTAVWVGPSTPHTAVAMRSMPSCSSIENWSSGSPRTVPAPACERAGPPPGAAPISILCTSVLGSAGTAA